MKSRVPGKASKASLVARGLPSKSKPPAFKRVQKGQQKAAKESKPGYSLYTSDSEDQASAVDRGLNRCAALLSNILDNEDKDGTAHSTIASMGKPVKSTIKRVPVPASQPTVRPGKFDAQRTKPISRKVVIPTARPDERASPSQSKPNQETNGASTAYNDRLVSSTPVLTAEERQKREQLQRREAGLQHELIQLKERYELLQRQQSPSHQTEQKLQLQHSMMQELENHQQKENSLQPHAAPEHSTRMQTVISSESKEHPKSNQRKTTARRSLDYSGLSVRKAQESDASSNRGFDDSKSGRMSDLIGEGHGHDDEVTKQGVDDSVTQQVDTLEANKRVRIVSPSVNEKPLPTASHRQNVSNSADEGLRNRRVTPPPSNSGRPSPASVRYTDGLHLSSAENQTRMIQYLVDELRALLGSTGDLEVDRLLNEIVDAAKLLPYLMEKDKTTSATQDIEQAVQPFKVENAQLRRRLLIAHQKLKEGSLKKQDDKSSGKTDLAFELAACRSVNTVLQKQLTEEKNNKEEILRHRDQLSQNLSELQEEKKKFLQILSNKEQDLLRLKRESQQDSSKLTVENKKIKADLEAVHLSSEAEKKEVNILSLSLKQKDAEIDRLKELTRGLQQSLTRLLSDIQQFQPKDLLKNGLVDHAVSFEGLDNLLRSDVRTIGQSTASRFSPEVRSLATRTNGNSISPRTLLARETPSFDRIDEALTRTMPNQRSVIQTKKHLRFADGPLQPETAFALTSGLSRPLVMGNEGSGYKFVDPHERSAHADNMESREGVLEMEDLEEEQNGVDLSPLLSGEEDDFRRGLENLDANILRIQRSLRETALRT